MPLKNSLKSKTNKLVIGLMSGTSADGIDAVVVEIQGSGTATKLRQRAFQSYLYPKGYKEFLLKNSNPETAKLDDVARLNILIGELFADAAGKIARKAGKKLSDIDLIGSHGQTIQHLPKVKKMFGENVRATQQLGHPSVIAKRTGVITIGDFRIGDVAVGGTGAPLVPYFDYIMFRSTMRNRGLLNIGGIANITVLPKHCSLNEVFAFDTGPGNMVVDGLMQRFYRTPFDKKGKLAARGKILPMLLTWMMSRSYFRKSPPKSTGREMFGDDFIKQILRRTKGELKRDIIATATEFTAASIYQSYLKLIRPKCHLDEIFVSGGGVHNEYLFLAVKKYFQGVKVLPIENIGFSSDAKEALCFAVLANETISGNPANVRAATGASRETVLGVIALP